MALFQKKVLLDENTPFAQASIWAWQRHFYASKGLDAWDACVPFLITNNVVIAEQYAQAIYLLIKGQIEQNRFDFSQPFCILELGAGHGRFCFLCLTALLPMLKAYNPKIKVRYVLSDHAQSNLDFWQAQPQLKTFVSDNILDFALFDLENHKDPIQGIHHKNPLNKTNPLILFANYIIDTIASNFYQFDQDRIEWATLTAETDKKNVKQGSPKEISDIAFEFNYEACPNTDDAPPFLKDIWASYQPHQLKHIPIPEIFMQALEHLIHQGYTQLFLIASDHGYTNLDELKIAMPPEIKQHSSFSIMVNFDAIGHFFAQKKGQAYTSKNTDKGLKTCFFSLNLDTEAMPDLKTHMDHVNHRFNAADFLALIKPLKQHNDDILAWISILKCCDWDPIVLQRYKKNIHKLIKKHMEGQAQNDVYWHKTLMNSLDYGLQRAARWYYFMPNKNSNLHFDIGHTYHLMNNWPQAKTHYNISEKDFGLDFETAYNLAVCYLNLKEKTKAQHYLAEAKKRQPDHVHYDSLSDLINSLDE